MFGFLNVYKPVGKTSHDVVAYFRRILKIKKIGHTGTLDPFAEGVLPICIGKSTRLIEYLNEDKAYLAFFKFGKSTDSFDIDGKVISESDIKVSEKQVKDVLKTFEGEIEQVPPIYSAIKVAGKKLYEYAREGKQVEIKPRKVFISNIELKEFNEDLQEAQIYIECSRGTYIRSIANDLGQILQSGAYLTRLIRAKSGKFTLENSTKMEDFTTIEQVLEKLINPLEMLDVKTIEITESEYKKALMGQPIINKNVKDVDFVILVYNNTVIATANVVDSVIKVNKVF